MVKVAISGCVHGELEAMYDTVRHIEQHEGVKVDLLLCCGDFQSVRNSADLLCMAVPPKFRQMNTFYKYYSGELQAPVLTIFVGGNHEASNYLQELPYGGWVAPNIYYMGTCGSVYFRGLRIVGLSGIFKHHDYTKPHFECVPYSNDTMRSVYHTRAVDVFRAALLARSPAEESASETEASQSQSEGKRKPKRVDIVLSHDWPTNVYRHGDQQDLLRRKPFFREEVQSGQLGSPPLESLLHALKPRYWFAAHLHCAFAALVHHEGAEAGLATRFLALDKALPHRHFLQIVDIEPEDADCGVGGQSLSDEPDAKLRKCDAPADELPTHRLQLDPVFLAVLRKTNALSRGNFSDIDADPARFAPSVSEVRAVEADFDRQFDVPLNFAVTSPCTVDSRQAYATAAQVFVNPQTTLLCTMLDLSHPNAEIARDRARTDSNADQVDFDAVGRFAERANDLFSSDKVANPDEICLSDDDDEQQESANA